jgi:hypothetical protein
MAALVLGIVALATVVFSFAFAVLVLALTRYSGEREHRMRMPSDEVGDDQGNVTETMSRVLAEVERLAALRDRGALTDQEFAAQKAKVLLVGQNGDRPPLPQRAG